jgi:hypothetical protein
MGVKMVKEAEDTSRVRTKIPVGVSLGKPLIAYIDSLNSLAKAVDFEFNMTRSSLVEIALRMLLRETGLYESIKRGDKEAIREAFRTINSFTVTG